MGAEQAFASDVIFGEFGEALDTACDIVHSDMVHHGHQPLQMFKMPCM